ncbi:MAG: UDP-N-acetylglucosamine 2-epimerase (non-hydrolyzing) [Tannerella sp.]|jgi:UDP-GlcNAc3NAcA epimerase|nr:UDP-N-acetylglucosamine 2-epimerase (non-hydrolyzing) [Tannerella sp.]
MKILTVIGARPQFVKAAVVSNAIKQHNNVNTSKIEELILHTGQHYDANMNDVFFSALGLDSPYRQLSCGGIKSRTKALAAMLEGIDEAINGCRPDFVMVYGDTTSTLAGALAASQSHIPLIHIEAGLRSFNRQMPEENNRIITDHLASLLFCPTYQAIRNLKAENITDGLFHCGDVMYDAALTFGAVASQRSSVLSRLGLKPFEYRLCTVHRAENTDNSDRLSAIFNALSALSSHDCPVVLPLHPRTALSINDYHLSIETLKIIDPVDYFDMLMLEKNAATILTDSGGVQKEAYFQRVPCVTLRNETEWVETVAAGWNVIAGCEPAAIINGVETVAATQKLDIEEYGDGHAADKIILAINSYYNNVCGRK